MIVPSRKRAPKITWYYHVIELRNTITWCSHVIRIVLAPISYDRNCRRGWDAGVPWSLVDCRLLLYLLHKWGLLCHSWSSTQNLLTSCSILTTVKLGVARWASLIHVMCLCTDMKYKTNPWGTSSINAKIHIKILCTDTEPSRDFVTRLSARLSCMTENCSLVTNVIIKHF